MGILKEKYKSYTAPQELINAGVYPYFRAIESDQHTVVKIKGKDVMMFGSNSYLGLTNHPEVKEAAIKAERITEAQKPIQKTLEERVAELEKRLAKLEK